MKLDIRFVVCGVLVALFLLAIITTDPEGDEQAYQEHRCTMVMIWKQSGGEYGWPPSVAPECGDKNQENWYE